MGSEQLLERLDGLLQVTIKLNLGGPFTIGSASVPSIDNARFVLNEFICEANRRKAEYFYFDMFNGDWKRTIYGTADEEFHWGLATSDRILKDYVELALICKPSDTEPTHHPQSPTIPPYKVGCFGTWCSQFG